MESSRKWHSPKAKVWKKQGENEFISVVAVDAFEVAVIVFVDALAVAVSVAVAFDYFKRAQLYYIVFLILI